MRAAPVRAVALAVALLAAASCGADGGGDEPELDAEAYRAAANTVCREGTERVDAMTDDLAGQFQAEEEPSPDELQRIVQAVLDDIRRQIGEIRELDGPESLEEDVHPVLDDAAARIETMEAEIEDDPMAPFLAEEDPFEDVNRRLIELGLQECGAE